ncbi:MAG: TonB-dependent receptor [Arcobacteraceae bacterium]|jgi:outer membrane receptor for ferrienterochelin and colicins|nr:TonB-dependent receptor [Arcobacteraceae bacterium]
MDAKKIIALSLVASSVLFANETIKLNEIVTIGTKTENSVQNLPMQVAVITEQEIQNSGASNVGEILNSEGSIYLNQSGGNGATMSIRGMAHADTLILIDGKRVNGEFSKTYELDRIPAGAIEKIEIVKGSSALLYGSDAMGGVINIITKKSDKPFEGDITLTHGKNKNSADLNVMGNVGDTSYKISGGYLKRDAFSKKETTNVKVMQAGVEKSPSILTGSGNWATLKANLDDSYTVDKTYQDNMKLQTFSGGISQKLSDALKVDVDISYLKEEKDANNISTIYETNYIASGTTKIKAKYIPSEQYDENERIAYSLGVDYNPSNDLEVKYTLSNSKYEKDRKIYTPLWEELGYPSKEASISSQNQSTIKHANNDLRGIYKYSPNSKISAGVEHRITDVTSTAYNVDDRKYTGGFVQHEYKPLEKLNLIYGARYDKDSQGENATSLSAGGVYEIAQNTKIKANYSEGFRAPDDRELYIDQTSPNGKKMLGATVIDATAGKTTTWEIKPETSKTMEIGLNSSGDIWSFELTAFQTDIKDRISQVATTNYTSFENISDSQIKGFESGLNIAPIENFMAKITYSQIDAKNETANTDLTYTPEKLASLSLSFFPTSQLEIKTITKYTGEQTNSDNEEIKSFDMTNLKVIYTGALKNLDLFAGADNVFGQSVAEDLGAVEKFNYYAGIKYKF